MFHAFLWTPDPSQPTAIEEGVRERWKIIGNGLQRRVRGDEVMVLFTSINSTRPAPTLSAKPNTHLETSGRIAARLPPIDVGLGFGAALVAPGPALFLVQGTDTDVHGLPLPDLALAYCLLLRLGLGRREQTGARGPNLTGQSRRVLFVLLALGMGGLRDNPCFFDFPLALGLGGLVCQREASVLIEGVQRMCHIVPEH